MYGLGHMHAWPEGRDPGGHRLGHLHSGEEFAAFPPAASVEM